MAKFKNSFSASVKGPNGIGGDVGFESSLSSAAKTHNIEVEVPYDTVGDPGDIVYDTPDVSKTFQAFRVKCKPANAVAHLRHYD